MTFDEVYNKYDKPLRTLAASFCRSAPDDVDDIMQEIWVKVARYLPTYDPAKARPRTWIMNIGLSVGRDYVRNRSRQFHENNVSLQTFVDIETGEVALENAEDNADPEAIMLAEEAGVELYDALDGLPEREREVFLLREFEGLSHGDIADTLGISRRTARSYLTRAKQNLRTATQRFDL